MRGMKLSALGENVKWKESPLEEGTERHKFASNLTNIWPKPKKSLR